MFTSAARAFLPAGGPTLVALCRLPAGGGVGGSFRLLASRAGPGPVRTGFAGRLQGAKAGTGTAQAGESLGQRVAGASVTLGQGAAMGGAAVGLAALCWYGMGMASQPSVLDKSVAWPAFVRERIRDTYGYLGLGVAGTAAATLAAFRSPRLMRLFHGGSWVSIGVSAVACIGSCIAVQAVPYHPGLGAKQVAFLGFAGLMGCLLAPVCAMGGPLVARAALYTGGIFAGLSSVAVCAPDRKFLTWGGPLSIGLGVVFVSSLGSAFLGPASSLGLTMYSISMYGGLLLFSAFLLYDTQVVAERAQTVAHYDPVNQAIRVYMDVLNIFVRVASMMSGGSRKK